MKKLSFILLSLVLLSACRTEVKQEEETPAIDDTQSEEYASYGDIITKENVKSVAQFQEAVAGLQPKDTLDIKFKSITTDVCVKKGCWMKLENPGSEDLRVRFKDYGFFVPTDLGKQEVIVSGKAYLTETSVDDLRHYAEDAGKSEEEIAAITEPEKNVAFIANGVLIKS